MRSLRFAFLISLLAMPIRIVQAQVSVTTQHNDNGRTGQNISETILTPANVNLDLFGKLFTYAVDGYVYAQPLYLPNVSVPNKGTHNVVYVATEHDSLYAFDADSDSGSNSTALWKRTFINPAKGITTVSSSDVQCADLIPEIGITGTPVIDTTTGTIYLIVKTKENGHFAQRLHAVDIASGAEKFGGPILIRAKMAGNGDGSVGGTVSFDPLREGQRPGLLLQNGAVLIAWASHCDVGPYHAWIMSYNAQTLQQTGVWNSTANGGLGGVWMGGAGLAGDVDVNTYLATGNGTFDVNSGGRDFGDSIVKLAPPANSRFRIADYFTPFDQDMLDSFDIDLGSGGLVLLPDQSGPHPHLLVQAGKEGTVYLIDRDQMGHYNPSNNDQIVQSLTSAVGGIWGAPAWWNNHVYFGGSEDYMKMFSFDPVSGKLSTSPTSQSETYYPFPGPTPSISANGNTGGIAWTLQIGGTGGTGPAILHAYDATDISIELYNSNQNPSRDSAGRAVKFTVPTIANGKVYVPASRQLNVYGLLPTHQSGKTR